MNKHCVEVIGRFVTEQAAEGKADNTVRTYERIMLAFNTWLMNNGGNLSDLTRHDVQTYIRALESEGKAASTVDKVYACLSVFARHIGRPNVVDDIKRIRPASKRSVAPKSLDDTERRRLLRSVEKSGNLRNIAIVYTLLETGVRVSELCALNRDDVIINARSGSLTVRDGKGGVARVIPLSRDVRYHLSRYLAERPDDDPALFTSTRGRISVRTVQHILAQYNTHPHALRHTFARRLVAGGIDIAVVADLAGHADINVTRRYAQPTADELAEAIERAFT